MRFNTLLKLSSLLGLAGLVQGSGYRMSFYGLNGNRPSDSAIPACGLDAHYNTDYYIALNKEQYYESQVKKDNPNTASVCDKCVKISYQGKWVVGRIVDSCPGCPRNGLDVSPTIFEVFAHQDVGIIYMDWEYADCSLLGKSSSSSSGSDSSSEKKTTTKKTTTTRKTTTRKTTTTTTRKTTTTTTTTTTTIARPTQVFTTKVIATKTITNARTLTTNINVPKINGVIVNTSVKTATATATIGFGKINQATTINKVNQPNTTVAPVTKPTNNVSQSIQEDSNESTGTYVLPITGALAVTGAAGIALVYVKRDSKNVNALKEKFPEAFSNIKRSISRGSTVVKRSLSQSGKALKRSLSKKGDTSMNMSNAAGPHIRTKKEYRDSLNAHYPLQPVQLYDPPVPSANNEYSSVPQYNLQRYNTNNDDNNLRIDFHDSYNN